MGSLYKQAGGRIWWVKYHSHGRPVRESTGTADDQEAKRFLKTREGQVASGQPLLPRLDRVRYEEVVEDLRKHYEATRTRDLRNCAGGSSISTAASAAGTLPRSGNPRWMPTWWRAGGRARPVARSAASWGR
jgi:hypothetical protein